MLIPGASGATLFTVPALQMGVLTETLRKPFAYQSSPALGDWFSDLISLSQRFGDTLQRDWNLSGDHLDPFMSSIYFSMESAAGGLRVK